MYNRIRVYTIVCISLPAGLPVHLICIYNDCVYFVLKYITSLNLFVLNYIVIYKIILNVYLENHPSSTFVSFFLWSVCLNRFPDINNRTRLR